MSKFEFELRNDIHTTIIEADCKMITKGKIEANTPKDATAKIIEVLRPDLVEDDFAHLAPVITIERNQNGSFTVDIETHGLCNATLELEQVPYKFQRKKVS